MNAQTHGTNGFSLLRVELYLPGNLPTFLCESETTDGLTVLLFCDVYIDIGVTLKSACVLFVDAETYRLTVWRHYWHCWLCHNYNQLRLAPSIP